MSELVQVVVEKVVLEENIGGPFVLLRKIDGEVYLPISIGFPEAQSILFALEHVVPPRPLTHDLIIILLASLEVEFLRIVINDLQNNTFYARIVLKKENRVYSIDARPSDSIAIALRKKVPVFVAKHVMDKAGQYNLT